MRRGPKTTRNHTTVIPAGKKVVNWLNKNKLVNRVSLGMITQARNGRQAIRIKVVSGGVEVRVRGASTFQVIRVYSSQTEQVARELEKAFCAS